MKKFIIPSIDLLDGKIVRLYKGDYTKTTVYDLSIDEILLRYDGFSQLHIVDLNGAKGDGMVNINSVKKIRDVFRGKIQIGGGIRSVEIAEMILNDVKVDRIVLGTAAINNLALTQDVISVFGKERVVLAVDCKFENGKFRPKVNGWKENIHKDLDLFDVLAVYDGLAKYILVTDIAVDGTMQGCNVELYRQIKDEFPGFTLQASGGVASLEDATNIQKIADGVVVGKALYEGLIDGIC